MNKDIICEKTDQLSAKENIPHNSPAANIRCIGFSLKYLLNIRILILCIFFTFLFCGCDYLRMTFTKVKVDLSLSQDPKPQDIKQGFPGKCGILMGNVTDHINGQKPMIIIACPSQNANIIADYSILTEPGPYLLFVPEGKYHVFAFEDLNHNQIYEKNEFVGQLDNPRMVSIIAGQVIGKLDFEITKNKVRTFSSTIAMKVTSPNPQRLVSLEQGGTVNLDHDFFSDEFGTMGLWNVSTFIATLGINIYALTPFDKSKIPILFIHGSGGTPKDWKFFADKINTEKYQIWFFYYPTGLRLQTLSDLLNEKLSALHNKIQFNELIITAHSLGGLITKKFIDRYDLNRPPYHLKLFITLATPWGGVDSAKNVPEKGLLQIPPSWRDLAPGSKFIKDLYEKKLSPHIPFYLFFGYQGNLAKGSGDGSIEMRSLLDHRAQEEAIKCFGFNETHTSILTSEEVVRKYQVILQGMGRQ